MSRNHRHFSHFSISHQTYTTYSTLDYHSSITQSQPYSKISHTMMINYPQKRLKIMKMMVSWKQKKILRKKRVYSKISHTIVSTIHGTHTTKTTRDHEDDGIMETEEDCEEEESLLRRHRVLCFIFHRECDMIYVSFRIQPGVLCFWGVLGSI